MPEQCILQYVNSLCDITALDLNAVRAWTMTGWTSDYSELSELQQ